MKETIKITALAIAGIMVFLGGLFGLAMGAEVHMKKVRSDHEKQLCIDAGLKPVPSYGRYRCE